MFDNIGNKIKTLALVTSILTIIACVFVAIYMAIEEQYWYAAGFAILGPLSAWISSFVLYGFGQLIENSDKIANNTEEILREMADNSPVKSTVEITEQVETKPVVKEATIEALDDLLKDISKK